MRRFVALTALALALVFVPTAQAAVAPPTNVHVTAATRTSISIAWSGAATRYSVWRNGVRITKLGAHSYTFAGLSCGTSYQLGVRAISGTQTSGIVTISASTVACVAGVSPALFGRVDYDGVGQLSIAAEADRYGLFDLQPNSNGIPYANAIKAAKPSDITLAYQDGVVTRGYDPTGESTGVAYQDAWPAHPDWFLYDSAGNRVESVCSGGTPERGCFGMDVANVGYQQAWVDHVKQMVATGNFNGVFIDEINECLCWEQFDTQSVKYPTNASWSAAETSFLNYIAPRLQAAGIMVFANTATLSTSLWQQWGSLVDGQMEESWTDGGVGLAQQVPYFPQKLADAQWSEDHGKLLLVHSYNGGEAANTYGLAAMLLTADGQTYYDTANTNVTNDERWFPEYDQAKQLGAPLGRYTVEASGVYRRDFQHGYVRANVSTSAAGGLAATSGQIVVTP